MLQLLRSQDCEGQKMSTDWVNQIYHMDCIKGLQKFDENCIDAIITDPLCEIAFTNKRIQERCRR